MRAAQSRRKVIQDTVDTADDDQHTFIFIIPVASEVKVRVHASDVFSWSETEGRSYRSQGVSFIFYNSGFGGIEP